MLQFLFTKKSVVTFDIGSGYIKAARFDITEQRIVLTDFEMAATPKGTVDKGLLIEPGALNDLFSSLIKEKMRWKKHQSKFILMLAGKSVITKKIDIPKTESKITKEHVALEIGQYLPFDVEEANYDFIELPFLSEEESMNSIFFTAASKKMVSTYGLCFTGIGVDVDVMDTAFFALERVLSLGSDTSTLSLDKNVLILDIGCHLTGFHVVQNNHIIFSRDLAVGSNTYVQEIERRMAVSSDEAHHLLISASEGGAAPDEVLSAVENFHESFSRDILMGYEFFLNYFPDAHFSTCFVTGGGSLVPGLKEELSKKLEVEVRDLPSLRSIGTRGFSKKKLEEIQPFASNSIGMALRLLKK